MVKLDPAIPKDRSEILRIIKEDWSFEELSQESFVNQPREVDYHVLERKTPLGTLRLVIQEIKL
jgi:hypothetical protein